MVALYIRAVALFRDLAIARADGSLRGVLARLSRIDVLVIDDWAMAPVAKAERRDFWEICEDRYQTRSTILTSQLPVARWHEQIGDPTAADGILDRLVHNAHRIEMRGDSMRKKRGASAVTALGKVLPVRRDCEDGPTICNRLQTNVLRLQLRISDARLSFRQRLGVHQRIGVGFAEAPADRADQIAGRARVTTTDCWNRKTERRSATEVAGKAVRRLGAEAQLVLRKDGLEHAAMENTVPGTNHEVALFPRDLLQPTASSPQRWLPSPCPPLVPLCMPAPFGRP